MQVELDLNGKKITGTVESYDGNVAIIRLSKTQTIPIIKSKLPRDILIKLERRKK